MYNTFGDFNIDDIFSHEQTQISPRRNLLQLLSNDVIDIDSIDAYLQELTQNNISSLMIELSSRNESGDSALHIAVRSCNIELVSLLISYDAPVDLRNANRETPEQIARERLKTATTNSGDYKKIVALINSRGRWQSAIGANYRGSINRSIRAIEEAVGKTQGADNRDAVMVFGVTGEGKSALINYILGIAYRVERSEQGRWLEKINPDDVEPAKVGNTSVSETLYPGVYSANPDLGYVFADMPGFGDTRGSVEEVCAVASIQMLTKQLHGIKGLVLTCSYASLFELTRMNPYREAAIKIGKMLMANTESSVDNIIFVLTKPNVGIKVDSVDVWRRLQTFWVENKLGDMLSNEEVEVIDEDYIDKLALMFTTKAILRLHLIEKVRSCQIPRGELLNRIFIGDVTNPTLRRELKVTLQSLPVRAVCDFNITNYHSYMNRFCDAMEAIATKYNTMRRNIDELQRQIAVLQTSIREIGEKIISKKGEAQEWEQKKSDPFNPQEYDRLILSKGEELNAAIRRNDMLEGKISHAADRRDRIMRELRNIQNMESNKKVLIDNIVKYTSLDKKPSLGKRVLKGARIGATLGSVLGPLGFIAGTFLGGAAGIAGRILAKKPTPFVDNINYDSEYPISWEQEECLNGTISERSGIYNLNDSMSLSEGRLRLEFRSNDNAFGRRTGFKINIFARNGDLPATRNQIEELRDRATALEHDLTALRENRDGANEDIANLKNTIRSLEDQRAKAIANDLNRVRLCRTQIGQLMEKIRELETRSSQKQKELQQTLLSLEEASTELEVNEEFFVKLAKIISIIDHSSELLRAFQASIQQQLNMSAEQEEEGEVEKKQSVKRRRVGGGSRELSRGRAVGKRPVQRHQAVTGIDQRGLFGGRSAQRRQSDIEFPQYRRVEHQAITDRHDDRNRFDDGSSVDLTQRKNQDAECILM